MLKINFHKKRT